MVCQERLPGAVRWRYLEGRVWPVDARGRSSPWFAYSRSWPPRQNTIAAGSRVHPSSSYCAAARRGVPAFRARASQMMVPPLLRLLRLLWLLLLLPQRAIADETVATGTRPYFVRFHVQLDKAKRGSFDIIVHPGWAPIAAARFHNLVKHHWFDSARFFRVRSAACLWLLSYGARVGCQRYARALATDLLLAAYYAGDASIRLSVWFTGQARSHIPLGAETVRSHPMLHVACIAARFHTLHF